MAWMSGVATSGAMAGAGSDDVSPSARAAMACSTVSIVVSGEPTKPARASLMAQAAPSCDFGQVEERKMKALLILPRTKRESQHLNSRQQFATRLTASVLKKKNTTHIYIQK